MGTSVGDCRREGGASMTFRFALLLVAIVGTTASVGMHSDCDGHGGSVEVPADGGGGDEGGGGGEPAPTPDPWGDEGVPSYDGPVPQEFIDASGATTWEGVRQWMDQQFAAASVSPSFEGTIEVHLGDDPGEAVEIVTQPDRQEPPITPEPEEGAPRN